LFLLFGVVSCEAVLATATIIGFNQVSLVTDLFDEFSEIEHLI